MGMPVREYKTILYSDLLLKIEGFSKRMEHEEAMIRLVAYSAYIAPHLNPSKMAKNIEAFWPMKNKGGGKKISDARREAVKLELQRRNLENNGG